MKITAIAAIDKPTGMTSSDVVIKCRNALSRATGERQKCGHMGTLDPMASGVLVLGFGKAARLFDLMQIKTKTYVATMRFGYTTDTLDAEGAVTQTCGSLPTREDLERVLPHFVGEIEQIPPKYSALNIDGKRAYDLARSGKEFVIPSRKVVVESISVTDIHETDGKVTELTFETTCGSGTYIRSLCRDIAAALDTLGCMTALRRTRSGAFDIRACAKLSEFCDSPQQCLLDPSLVVDKMLPRADVDEITAAKLKNGRNVELGYESPLVAVYCGELLGIARRIDGTYKLETRICD